MVNIDDKWVKTDEEDLIITINVKTQQKEDTLFINGNGKITITVKDPPVKGKANKKIGKILKKKLGVRSILVAGKTSTTKVFRLESITKEKIIDKLENNKE